MSHTLTLSATSPILEDLLPLASVPARPYTAPAWMTGLHPRSFQHMLNPANSQWVKNPEVPTCRLVAEAQSREAPVQRLADWVAGKFCYTVMAASAATFAFWSTLGM